MGSCWWNRDSIALPGVKINLLSAGHVAGAKITILEAEKVSKTKKLSKETLKLIKMRDESRKNKNWKLSDKIRDELIKKGIKVSDNEGKSSYT